MKPVLSIYIPTFNRKDLLYRMLNRLPEAIGGHREAIEIVLSDNASQDGTAACIEPLCRELKADFGLNIRYHRNTENIGSCRNFLQVSELTQGEFCWILGDDDFILPDGIDRILSVLNRAQDLDYFLMNYVNVPIRERNEILSAPDRYRACNSSSFEPFVQETTDRFFEGFEELYELSSKHPVRLGTNLSMHLFRRRIWESGRWVVSAEQSGLTGKNAHEDYRLTLDWVFPHLKILSHELIGKKVGYIGCPVFGAGIGSQENSEDNWPLIDVAVLREMYDWLEINGAKAQALHCFLKDYLPLAAERMVQILADCDETVWRSAGILELFSKWGSSALFYAPLLKTLDAQLVAGHSRRYIDYTGKYFETAIDRRLRQQKKIAVWGSGQFCTALFKHCKGLAESGCVVVDSNPCVQGTRLEEYHLWIQAPSCLKAYRPDVVLIASEKYADEIRREIVQMGLDSEIISSS